MTLLLAVVAFSIFIGYRAEKMDRRRYTILLGFITLVVVAQLVSFYVAPPQQLFIPYSERSEHAVDEGGPNP
jgi:hypothetical protein